jgi:SAM-dependent methyltransferase
MNTARLLPVISRDSPRPSSPPRSLGEQFANPTGWLGSFVGRLMATSSARRSRWVTSLLGLESGQHVLEVGFGPGVDIQRVSAIVGSGIVAGVDHSPTMFRMASQRNALAIAQGRVHLEVASAGSLPFDGASFDRAFSINCVQFWPDLGLGLSEARRVLKPGGRVAVAIQPRDPGATAAETLTWRQRLETGLRQAGFLAIQSHLARTRPLPAVCVLGIRPVH